MNFAGEVMSFEMPAELFSGAQAAVLLNDDVVTAGPIPAAWGCRDAGSVSPAPARPYLHTGT